MSFRQKYVAFLHRKPTGLREELIWMMLKGLAHVYQGLWWVRRLAYRLRILSRRRLSCPVVSVGNITTGGTGKTPIVIHLAAHFISEGLRVAVLSRGYGGKRDQGKPLWVSDGQKLLAGPREAGDEPVLIARKVPKAAVVVCPNRILAGQAVIRRFKPDLIILDDGFQRRYTTHRDLDLVVIDGIQPFSTGRVLPAGLLREPLDALADAGVFILNKADLARSVEDIRTQLARWNPRAPVIESVYRVTGLRDLLTGRKVKPSLLDGVPVGILAGIGNPLSFVRTLAQSNIVVRHAYTLDDHFAYNRESLKGIVDDAKARGLLYLVTTEKDEVKLPKSLAEEIPVLVQEIEWVVTEGMKHWETILKSLQLSGGKD